MRFFVIYWLPVVAWMIVIFLLSTSRFSMKRTARFIEPMLRFVFRKLQGERLSLAHSRVRESAHFAEYLVLGLLLFRAVRGDHEEFWRADWMAISFILTVMYASLDELHQKWEAGRTAKLKHVWIDIAGGCAAQALLFVCRLFRAN